MKNRMKSVSRRNAWKKKHTHGLLVDAGVMEDAARHFRLQRAGIVEAFKPEKQRMKSQSSSHHRAVEGSRWTTG